MFSPVIKLVTVRVVLTITVTNDWLLYQLDINNVVLHGHIDEELYMLPLEGYDVLTEGMICMLKEIIIWSSF